MHLEPLADGRINLTAIGDERFRIHGLNDQKPYLIGEVEFLDFNITGTINLPEAVSRPEALGQELPFSSVPI